MVAAITSCTNTSNPRSLVAAGLVAKNAVERGLSVKPWVKTSLAPGSRVVTDYLELAGLIEPLDGLGFYFAGYGCTTCIGNTGPLFDGVSDAVNEHDLSAVSVLSGNRNFEGRIHPDVKQNFLASPPLVVAYALAGTIDIDLSSEPLGVDPDGVARVSWRTSGRATPTSRPRCAPRSRRRCSKERYASIFSGDERWRAVPTTHRSDLQLGPKSTYVKLPPFFDGTHHGAGLTSPTSWALACWLDSVTRSQPTTSPPRAIFERTVPPGKLPRRLRRGPQGLQQLRHAPRQLPSDDARHLREHSYFAT